MNRRRFFTRLSTGLVSACVATQIPTSWLPAPVQKYAATEFMTKAWNKAMKGQSLRTFTPEMYVGAELFDAFSSEIIASARYVATDELRPIRFKSARVHRVKGRGWSVRVPLPEGKEYRAVLYRGGILGWVFTNV